MGATLPAVLFPGLVVGHHNSGCTPSEMSPAPPSLPPLKLDTLPVLSRKNDLFQLADIPIEGQ